MAFDLSSKLAREQIFFHIFHNLYRNYYELHQRFHRAFAYDLHSDRCKASFETKRAGLQYTEFQWIDCNNHASFLCKNRPPLSRHCLPFLDSVMLSIEDKR